MFCISCKDLIYSKHRHDFVTCKCGNVSIDGGQDYTRYFGDPKHYWSTYFMVPEALLKEKNIPLGKF